MARILCCALLALTALSGELHHVRVSKEAQPAGLYLAVNLKVFLSAACTANSAFDVEARRSLLQAASSAAAAGGSAASGASAGSSAAAAAAGEVQKCSVGEKATQT